MMDFEGDVAIEFNCVQHQFFQWREVFTIGGIHIVMVFYVLNYRKLMVAAINIFLCYCTVVLVIYHESFQCIWWEEYSVPFFDNRLQFLWYHQDFSFCWSLLC